MKKSDRQRIIRHLIKENDIYRQEDLVAKLLEKGITVTQATISRDVKEMQLMKVPTENGSYRYSIPVSTKIDAQNKLNQLLKEVYLSSACHRDLCMLKVLPGNGPVVSNLLSQLNYAGLFAVLGDDDTVMLFTESEADAQRFQHQIIEISNR